MTAHNSGTTTTTTRRGVLRAAAGVLAAGTLGGCIGSANDAQQDMSVIQHDSLPTLERNWDPELEMGLSGAVLYTREGAEAHTLDIARYSPDGWFLDVVDLCLYDGPGNGPHEGEPMSDVRAEDLAEGSTVVLLAAHNDRGTVVSPDAENNRELNRLLPD